MKRLVDSELDTWASGSRRKPLIIRGARQVGKTHSVLDLGRRLSYPLAHINFERDPKFVRVFEPDLDPTRIVAELELLCNVRLLPGASLLFLDEIQACPKALASLRYFWEHIPALHVVAAGSLLEFALRDLSFPIGRVQFLEMYPMTFGEYLWAVGRELAADFVFSPPATVSPSVHQMLLDELRSYMRVGGMPEAVATFSQAKSYVEAAAVHKEIIEAFRADFPKYGPYADKECLRTTMESVPARVGSQVKYTHLAEGFSSATIRKAFDLLVFARLIRKVRSASPAGLPLAGHALEKVFKPLFLDIGLLRTLSGLDATHELEASDLLDVHRGAVAEQFVGQEILASQGTGELYCWIRQQRGSSAEVDYLVPVDNQIVPIEVKSGPAGKLRSLVQLKTEFPQCRRAIVLSSAPPTPDDSTWLSRLPLYFAWSVVRGAAGGS